jgi:alcohol dehydrogenase class IV
VIRYGPGAVAGIPEVVAGRGARRVLLVSGGASFESSGAAAMLPDLERVARVRRWSEFATNPDAADLIRGLAIVDECQPDLILGVGGGSVMDMAKLLSGFAGITDPAKLREAIRSGGELARRDRGLLLAPTTSGSGSEATHFAVVYIGHDKFSVGHPSLRADVVVLDPLLALSGSRYQKAASGMDAVAQAIESLWAVAATAASRRWARHALRLLLPAIETFVDTGTEESARAMAIGSHLAGRAIDTSRTTAAHALSYGITKRYGLSHGHAVALTLGGFIELHGQATPEQLHPAASPADLAEAMRIVLAALRARDPVDARRKFVDLGARLGLRMALPELAADAPALVSTVNVERLNNNPMRLSSQAMTELVAAAAGRG